MWRRAVGYEDKISAFVQGAADGSRRPAELDGVLDGEELRRGVRAALDVIQPLKTNIHDSNYRNVQRRTLGCELSGRRHDVKVLFGWVADTSAKNHKRQRRKRQSVTAKREKSQTPKVLTAYRYFQGLKRLA